LSHIPHRKEKDCLNCGTILQGPYCHHCGQENVVPKETFWHMVSHFFYDITHFDSNFFITLKHLLFKPGFLSKEYMIGRRASYLHPIKMYVFTSAMFFLLFFSFFAPKSVKPDVELNKSATKEQRLEYINWLKEQLKKDSLNIDWKKKLAIASDTSRVLAVSEIVKTQASGIITVSFTSSKFKNFREYDSAEKALPVSQRDGWITRRFMKMGFDVEEKFRKNPDAALKKFIDNLLHKLPYMLLVSLPFFALILKLVYIRRKHFYYADHGVFTIHLYIFSFIWLLAIFILSVVRDATQQGWINFITALLVLLLFFYLYKGMRNFYGQGRGKTFIKFLFVSFWSFIMMLLLFILFMFFSAVTF
jgi:hypothetical protein